MKHLYILLLLSCFSSATYAQFCSGTTTLMACSGEFDDGSGNSDYGNNTDCSWLIQVPEDSSILLFFTSFETESCCDDLRVYDGSSSSAPLIGEFNGSDIPFPIISNSNELFLEFTTDGSVTREGWSVFYTCSQDSFVDLGYEREGFPRLLSVDGSVVEYDFNLKNTGNQESGPFEIRFYASEDEEIESSDPLLFTEFIDSLPAKSSQGISGIRNVRDSIAPGEYRNIGFIIDPENEIEELVEENNTHLEDFDNLYIPFCSEITTLRGCQDTIGDGSGFENVTRESQCSWLVESENNESIFLDFFNVDLFITSTITIYDGEDQNAPLIQEFRGNDDFYPIVSTGSSVFFEFENRSSSSQGWDAAYFCTDTSIANLFIDQNSNANSAGSKVDFDLEIRNNGNTASPETKIYFFGSPDFDFDISEDFLIDSVVLPSIPSLGQLSLTDSIDGRTILPPGTYFPVAVIDPFNRVDELNKGDNAEVFSDQFYIPYCADTATVLVDCAGIVSDGSGPERFVPQSTCSWRISADTGQHVSLSLISADLGSSTTDLRFYDGLNNTAPFIAEFNGNDEDEIPTDIVSSGEHIYIEFFSGTSSFPGSGWDFQYNCTEDTLVNFDFVEDFNIFRLLNGEIRFDIDVRNYGNGPTPESKIYFFISPDESINTNDIIVDSAVLSPVIPYFQTNLTRTIIISELSPSIPGGEYYAGFFIDPLNEVAETNENDNSYIDDNDFSIPYCSEELQLIDECSGALTDGSGNNNYADNSDCRWLIEGPPGSIINLSFNSFNTQSCCDDLRVYDGSTSNAPLLGTFSGSTLPPNLQTTTNNAYFEFETNNSSSRSGWELEYECIQFYSNLRFQSGSPQVQITNNVLNFAAVIENDGVLPTGEFEVGLILSEDKVPSFSDFVLSSETLSTLEPDEEIEYEESIELSNLGIPAGEYFLIVRLDLDEVIQENDEVDNDFISAFPIDILSSVEEGIWDSEIVVFPRNHQIVIQNKQQHYLNRISLVRTDGVVLQHHKINNSPKEHKLDILQYPSGLYIVVIELEDQILVKKLFIPR